MVFEREQFLPRLGVPELDRVIVAGRGYALLVGREDGFKDFVRVAIESEQRPFCRQVPQPRSVIRAAREPPLAIARKIDRPDPVGVSRERRHIPPRRDIPELNCPVHAA